MTSLFPNSMRDMEVRLGSRVAILMRTKDRPVLLARAFASVLNQIHQDWHVYLVNDGGAPGAVDELCAQYAGAFGDRLTLIHHETSKGMEAASNSALDASRGDFVAVHDDDDSWHPHFLKRTVAFLNAPANAGCAAVAAKCVIIKERIEGASVIEERREDWVSWRNQIDFGGMLINNSAPPICMLIRRSAVDIVGKFNHHLPVLGDWDYNLRIMLIGDIGTINDIICYYHVRTSLLDNDVYGNSVVSSLQTHKIYNAYYTNSLVRPLLQANPGHLGLAHILLKNMHHQHEELRWQYNQLQERISRLDGSRMQASLYQLDSTLRTVNQILRVPRWAWRKLYPFRRFVAKMRGRI